MFYSSKDKPLFVKKIERVEELRGVRRFRRLRS
jgi:hypothetical protein